VLLLIDDYFAKMEVDGLTLELNSLGDLQCRPAFRQELLAFLREKQQELCPNCQNRLERNPLRVLDCKEESCIRATRDAPSILAFLCPACQEHFRSVQEFLRARGLPYILNPRMVRGLDYYCRTTFEWTSGDLGAQNTLAAGGRYDGLVQDLGGPAIPGVGFAMGVERLALLLEKRRIQQLSRPVLYVAWVGKPAQSWAFPLVGRLRRQGVRVEIDGEEKSLKSQMRRADKLRALRVLLIGEEELGKGKAILRNLDTKEQSEVSLDRIETEILELSKN
jgi:histidyl-tRNA synthetase